MDCRYIWKVFFFFQAKPTNRKNDNHKFIPNLHQTLKIASKIHPIKIEQFIKRWELENPFPAPKKKYRQKNHLHRKRICLHNLQSDIHQPAQVLGEAPGPTKEKSMSEGPFLLCTLEKLFGGKTETHSDPRLNPLKQLWFIFARLIVYPYNRYQPASIVLRRRERKRRKKVCMCAVCVCVFLCMSMAIKMVSVKRLSHWKIFSSLNNTAKSDPRLKCLYSPAPTFFSIVFRAAWWSWQPTTTWQPASFNRTREQFSRLAWSYCSISQRAVCREAGRCRWRWRGEIDL